MGGHVETGQDVETVGRKGLVPEAGEGRNGDLCLGATPHCDDQHTAEVADVLDHRNKVSHMNCFGFPGHIIYVCPILYVGL